MRTLSSFFTLLCVVLFSLNATAQTPYFSYETLQHGDQLSFPVFTSKSHPKAAQNINRLLQLSELRTIDGHYKNNLFEGVAPDTLPDLGYMYDLAFEVYENTPRLLSVRFSIGSCGATCFYWTNCYNFNAQTGEPLQLGDLLMPGGLKYLTNKAGVIWKAAVREAVEKQDDFEREAIEPIGNCYEDYPYDEFDSFYVQGTDIVIDAEGCLPKYAKAMDIDTAIHIPVTEIMPFISDYGRSVLGLSATSVAPFQGKPARVLVTGAANDELLVILIDGYNRPSAKACYANMREGLYLYFEGTYDGNTLQLISDDELYDPFAWLNIEIDDEAIKGTLEIKGTTKTGIDLLRE